MKMNQILYPSSFEYNLIKKKKEFFWFFNDFYLC